MSFHLNSTLIREYYVLEVIVKVSVSIRKPLGFVRIPDKLAVCASTVSPSQRDSTSQNHSQRDAKPTIREHLLELTRRGFVICPHLVLNDRLDGLRNLPRSPRASSPHYCPRFLVLHEQLVYAHTRCAETFSVKSLRYRWSFYSTVMKGKYPMLYVVAVNHSPQDSGNSHLQSV